MNKEFIIEKFKKEHPEAYKIRVDERFNGPEVVACGSDGKYLGRWWYNGNAFEKEQDFNYARIDVSLKNSFPSFGVYYTEKRPYEPLDESKLVKIVRERFMEEIKNEVERCITEDNLYLYVADLDGWEAPYSQIKDRLIDLNKMDKSIIK